MDEETYERGLEDIQAGKIVKIGGRTAATVADLDFLRSLEAPAPTRKQLTQRITNLEGGLVRAEADLSAEKSRGVTLEKEKAALEADKAELEKSKATLETEKARLQGQVTTLQGQLTSLQGQLSALQSQLTAASKAAPVKPATPGN